MIINSEHLESNTEMLADICIVGAGIAGITLAREFIQTGLKVIMIESGGIEPNEDIQSMNDGKIDGLPYYPLDKARISAFGGSSHAWHMDHDLEREGIVRLRGMDEIDFEKKDWVAYSGWPFRKAELDPYYERAHNLFKLGPYRYDADFWSDPDSSPEIPFRNGNLSTTIFQFARKDLFLQDYRRDLKNAANISVVLNATALNIGLNETATQTESIMASSWNGKKFMVKASRFILAQGGLETPRLLLLSRDRMRSGVGNQNDLVGRFFMEHPHLWSGIFYPSDKSIFQRMRLYTIHRRGGLPLMGKICLSAKKMKEAKILNSTVSLHYRPVTALVKPEQSFRNLVNAIRNGKISGVFKNDIRNLTHNPGIVTYAALRKITRGNRDKWYGPRSKYHGFLLNMMSEQSPDPESRVSLDTEKNRFGQNKIKLSWKLNTDDIRSMRRFQEIMDRELRDQSLGRLDISLKDDSIPESIHGGYHHMGTTRMNTDPRYGVVNENGRVHGIANLYIAGSSVFPTGVMQIPH
jgi:choline dehydrogenase-like flavoprotein